MHLMLLLDLEQPQAQFFYCWTHDETTQAWHTSKNCRKQKERHKMEATFHNRLQGSNAKPPPRNE
eukprot:14031002-Ditylum_brightwellii.AAC.1